MAIFNPNDWIYLGQRDRTEHFWETDINSIDLVKFAMLLPVGNFTG